MNNIHCQRQFLSKKHIGLIVTKILIEHRRLYFSMNIYYKENDYQSVDIRVCK
jgi:hypothetical protein